jgi:hypothetical protein
MFVSLIFVINMNYLNQSEIRLTSAKRVGVVLLFLIAFLESAQALRTLVADYYFFGWQKSFFTKEYFTAYTYYDYLDRLGIENYYYDSYILSSLFEASFQDWDFSSETRGEQIAGAVGEKYLSSDNYSSLRPAFWTLASNGDFVGAKQRIDTLIFFSPNLPLNYYDLGRLAVRFNETDLAEMSFSKAQELLPDLNNPHLNDLHKNFIQSFIAAIEAANN